MCRSTTQFSTAAKPTGFLYVVFEFVVITRLLEVERVKQKTKKKHQAMLLKTRELPEFCRRIYSCCIVLFPMKVTPQSK